MRVNTVKIPGKSNQIQPLFGHESSENMICVVEQDEPSIPEDVP